LEGLDWKAWLEGLEHPKIIRKFRKKPFFKRKAGTGKGRRFQRRRKEKLLK